MWQMKIWKQSYENVRRNIIIEYLIRDERDDIIKTVGKEIFYLQKGDVIYVNNKLYIVDNKHLDYDEKKVTLYVELDE